MKILWRPSLHLECALSSPYAFAKVLFLQVSVSRGILSVFLAGIVSSHRDAESSRMEYESLGKRKADPNFVCGPHRDDQ